MWTDKSFQAMPKISPEPIPSWKTSAQMITTAIAEKTMLQNKKEEIATTEIVKYNSKLVLTSDHVTFFQSFPCVKWAL